MKFSRKSYLSLVQAALIAAIYAVATIALAPISFGTLQVRVAEALTILAIYSPTCIAGLTLGCFLANIIGVSMGVNLAIDVLVGTMATLIAGIISYLLRRIRIKKIPVLSVLPPIIINAIFVGAEIAFMTSDNMNFGIFLIFALEVGAGELIACAVLGIPFMLLLEKTKISEKLL